MTESQREPAPAIGVAPLIRTGAGTALSVEVTVVNTSTQARQLTVLALGVDSAWLPAPVTTPLLAPSASYVVRLVLTPAAGTLPAQYPLAISVQALDATGAATDAPVGIADTVLVVSPRAQLTLELDPPTLRAWRSRRFALVLRNTGGAPAQVRLTPQTTGAVKLRLQHAEADVAAGAVLRIRGRVTARHPQLIGMPMRHVLRIGATGSEAARYAEGELTQRPLVPPFWLKLIAIVGILSIWIAAGVAFLPQLTQHFGGTSAGVSTQAQAPGKAGSGAGSGPGSGSGAGGGSGSGAGTTNGGPGTAGGGSTKAIAPGVQLNGTITATDPAGVHVSLRPTSLVDEGAELGTKTVGIPVALAAAVGKRSSESIVLRQVTKTPKQRATVTGTDGVWSFPRVSSPGYYLLVFTKPGYQSQSYVVDSSSAAAQKPLAVDLQPGQGKLSGIVTGPDGKPVGGAAITISDGTSTVTASSNTKGKVGAWSVSGLSTPASYIVSASADGESTEARNVTLGAGGSARANLTLRAGVATLSGKVSAAGPDGTISGFGGATVTVTDGADLVRTATTVTQDQLAGTYHVPALPAPGTYTVTISGPGLQSQTSRLKLAKGQGSATANATLASASGIVQGLVTGTDGSGLNDAGLVLSNADHTYKTTSTSGTTDTQAGSFQITGVTPGTYTLTTQLFGYQGDTMTVSVDAGGVATASPVIAKQPGGVLPTTATILGSAVDAATGQAITGCPTSSGTSGTTTTTTTTSGTHTTITTTSTDPSQCLTAQVTEQAAADQPEGSTTYVVPFGSTEQYRLPGTGPDSTKLGLRPGLYTVDISAPGYEDTTVNVQVPLGATVTAPVAQLLRAPTLQGTVGSGAIANPTGNTCIFAVPQGATLGQTCAQATSGTNPTCQPTPATYHGGGATIVCAYIAGTGSYRVQLPRHGIYTVYVVPSDPDFVTSSATFSFEAGGTQIFSPNLDRLGHVIATVLKPGPTGDLVAASANTTVTLTPLDANGNTDPSKTVLTSLVKADGTATMTGVPAGSYQLSATDAKDTQYSGGLPITVSLNHDTPVTLPLINPVGPILGKVTTSLNGKSQPIAGATVAITAPIAYTGSTPVRGTAAPVTNNDGCFGVQTTKTVPTPPCGTWTTGSLVAEGFLSTAASSVVVSAPGYQTQTLTNQTLLAGSAPNVFSLVPNPVTFAATMTAQPAGVSWGSVSFQVSAAGMSTSGISISASAGTDADTGVLAWTDTTLAKPGLIRPGVYTITASASGFQSGQGTLDCQIDDGTDASDNCGWTTPLVLTQNGSLTIGAAQAGGKAIPAATYTLTDTKTNKDTTLTAGTTQGSVTFSGLAPDKNGGRYQVRIQAAGYHFGTTGDGSGGLPLSCGSPATATTSFVLMAGAALSCTATLTPGPAITGTVKGLTTTTGSSTFEYLSGAVVKARHCTGTSGADTNPTAADCTNLDATPFTGTVGADGTYTITGSSTTELPTGDFRVSVAEPGWSDEGDGVAYVDVADDSGATADLALRQIAVTVTITLPDQLNENITDATVTLTGSHGTVSSASPAGGVYTFSNVMPDTYDYDVTGPSILHALGTFTAVSNADGRHGVQAFKLPVTLGASSFSGTIVDPDGTGIGNADVVLCPGTATTLCTPRSGTDGKPLSTTADGQGSFGFQNVPNGSYTVWASAYGFQTTGTTASNPYVVAYQNAPFTGVKVALPVMTQSVTLKIKPSAADDDLTDLQVKLTGPGSSSGLTPTGIAQDTSTTPATWVASFTGVPAGCWTAHWTLPSGHFGTIGTPAGTSDAGLNCANGTVLVSGAASNTPASASYSLTETEVSISVALGQHYATTPPTAPTTATVTLTQGSTNVGTISANVGGATATAWLGSGSWGLSAVGGGADTTWWPAATTTLSVPTSTTAALTLNELYQTINVSVVNGNQKATVVVQDASGNDYPLGTASKLANDGTTSFNLPPGTWTITVSRTGYDDATTTIDVTAPTPAQAVALSLTATPTPTPTPTPTGSPTASPTGSATSNPSTPPSTDTSTPTGSATP